METDVGTEEGEEKEKRWREREREVCKLLYEADLDRRRGLDTLRLWRGTVTAAVDCVCVCVCVCVCTCMFIAVYSRVYDVQFFSLYGIKMSLSPLKSGVCVSVCVCVCVLHCV